MMKPNSLSICFLVPFFCFVFIFIFTFNSLWAEQRTLTDPINNQFGGHLKLEGDITGYDAHSYFEPVGTDTGLDGAASIRLTDKLAFSDTFYVEAHYEAAVKSGDTRKKRAALEKNFPWLPGPMSRVSDMDNRRLFDLTKTMEETGNTLVWHRLDRLFFSAKPAWGDIMIGRQAVTWGNGLIFNPMDLFNPFSPADIVRDYKMGDDLVSVRLNTDAIEEITLLAVPRRNVTGNVDFDASSIAGKLHFLAGDMEMDLMGAWHYDETVFGIGATGYLGDTAWRCDIVWSSLEDTPGKNGYFQVVANIDYSWTWFNKNMYGLIEYYHNGLGTANYTDAFGNLALIERIDRGELFALGENYINTQIQVELHPLLNLYFNTIHNMKDPSGILQPRLSYSMTQNSTLLLGATIFYGSRESEYGGFLIPGTPYYTNAAANGYLLFTYYF